MLWLYLLAAVTVLVIALRRTRKKMKPLDDELYSKNVAIDHVQSGAAWVRADATFGSVNPSFARTLNLEPRELAGRSWFNMFPSDQHSAIKEQFSGMLLAGTATFDAPGVRGDGSPLWLNVRLVAVHDHHMRFMGHHCLVEDKTRLCELEEEVRALSANAEKRGSLRTRESTAPGAR
jgi:PAS domain S-box-containing protein